MVGAQLDQQVAVQPGGLERVVGEGAHRRQLQRLAAARPYRSSNRLDPDGQRHGQPVGGHARAEHVAVGRRLADAEVRRRAAGREEPCPAGERAQQVGQPCLAACRGVEGGDAGERLLGGGLRGEDPGLVRAVERVRRLRGLPVRTGRGGGASASAFAPPISTPPASAVPAAPDSGALEEVAAAGVHDGTGSFAAVSGPVVLQGDPERTRPTPAPLRWPRRRARARTVAPRRATVHAPFA